MSEDNIYSEKEKEFDDIFKFILTLGIDTVENYEKLKRFYCLYPEIRLEIQNSSENVF